MNRYYVVPTVFIDDDENEEPLIYIGTFNKEDVYKAEYITNADGTKCDVVEFRDIKIIEWYDDFPEPEMGFEEIPVDSRYMFNTLEEARRAVIHIYFGHNDG